jgi:hypothetical protein
MSKSFVLSIVACGCSSVVGSPGTAHVRVAHVSPGAPDVDFCVASHGTTTYQGPILAGAGRATGLAYAHVSKYFDLPADRYDVRLVAPGAADCSAPLAGLDDFTVLPDLDTDAYVTIAAEGTIGGDGDAAFTLRAYVDDLTVEAGSAKLKLVHASPGTPAVDVGTGGGVLFAPVFTNVEFGAASTEATTPPLSNVLVSARAHGASDDVLAIAGASLPDGTITTAFAIGELTSTDTPLRVMLCLDNAEPNGVHTQCTVVGDAPQLAHVRLAHLSPDAPPVDVCLAAAGSGAFGAPLARSLGAASLDYAQVTSYPDLPAASYDIRVIHATAGNCDTPAIPDTVNVAVAAGSMSTVAAIGELEPSGPAADDPTIRLAIYNDDPAVDGGQVKLRFVHASPGTPMVDVGLNSGASFQRVFANVAFGNIAVHPPLSNGYVATAPLSAPISARASGTTTDAIVVPHVTLEAGSISTAFAIGNKTGQALHPLQVLLCTDNKPATGLLAACVIAP